MGVFYHAGPARSWRALAERLRGSVAGAYVKLAGEPPIAIDEEILARWPRRRRTTGRHPTFLAGSLPDPAPACGRPVRLDAPRRSRGGVTIIDCSGAGGSPRGRVNQGGVVIGSPVPTTTTGPRSW